jgi:TRAP-type C4-dicarboxylate transport system permease small subunit
VSKLIDLARTADRVVLAALKGIAIAAFAVLTLILSLNILNRFVPLMSFHWLDEIVELCFAALVFYGAAAVWIGRGHFSAGDWISKRLPAGRARGAYRLFVELAGLLFIAVFLRYSWQLTTRTGEATAVFQIPKAVLYACMPVSGALMSVYSLIRAGAAVMDLAAGTKEAPPKE